VVEGLYIFHKMVIVGEKNYKHIDEGPIRSRRTRSPTAAAGDNGGSDDEGMYKADHDIHSSTLLHVKYFLVKFNIL